MSALATQSAGVRDGLPLPPQNLDAEESVLGAMMLTANAVSAVIEVVEAGDFYRESHRLMFRAALALYGRGEPVDAITLANELELRNELDAAGGKKRIHELATLVPAASNARHYAQIVHQTAVLRRLIHAGNQIAQLGWEGEGDVQDRLSQAERLVYEATQKESKGEVIRVSDALAEAFDRISKLYESGGETSGIASGFKDLDRITAGFQPGNLIILAARPSVGKSAFSLGVALNVASANVPCAFFALEMSRQEIAQRLICGEAKVDSSRLRSGSLRTEDWPRLVAACSRLEQLPMYLDDTPSLSLFDLRSRVQTLMRREANLGLIVVDYLQLMTAGDVTESRLQEVSALSRGLKAIARDFNVPVLALSQLSRAVEQRHDKRPVLADLRESGTLEQDADLVMLLYRDTEPESEGYIHLDVAKHRNGPTDTLKLTFLSKYAKFANAA